jgi:hypothetical protein
MCVQIVEMYRDEFGDIHGYEGPLRCVLTRKKQLVETKTMLNAIDEWIGE